MLVHGLAAVGAVTLIGSSVGWIRQRSGELAITGRMLGPDGRPMAGLSVFLDRGTNLVERYETDSAGAFRLPLFASEPHRAVWLLCPRGAIPVIGKPDRDEFARPGFTFRTYHYSRTDDTTSSFYRVKGWSGPIPRECPRATDSVGWRLPASTGAPWGAFSRTEPDWARYPGPPALP